MPIPLRIVPTVRKGPKPKIFPKIFDCADLHPVQLQVYVGMLINQYPNTLHIVNIFTTISFTLVPKQDEHEATYLQHFGILKWYSILTLHVTVVSNYKGLSQSHNFIVTDNCCSTPIWFNGCFSQQINLRYFIIFSIFQTIPPSCILITHYQHSIQFEQIIFDGLNILPT